jgi:alkylglycerol monooxygenase
MALNPIVLAVPFYFIGMGVEAAIDRKLRAGLYTVDDTLNNLACGLYQQLLTVVAATALMAPYYWIYQHARLTHWFDAHPVISWVAAFVLSDFFYYWFHRWSHESAIGWFSHVVHHQSEEYNLSVALRQDAWQPLFSMWFYLPLALLGLAPATFATAYGLVIVYQYWIHTRLIGRMGPLEWVFNTPSHHRVHHGVDPKYLDKNYAGVFIIWDRMFGTFQPEEESPTYGTIEPLASWNPSWAHLTYGVKLARKAASMPTVWDGLQTVFRSRALTNVGGLTSTSERARLAVLGAAALGLAAWAQQPRHRECSPPGWGRGWVSGGGLAGVAAASPRPQYPRSPGRAGDAGARVGRVQ